MPPVAAPFCPATKYRARSRGPSTPRDDDDACAPPRHWSFVIPGRQLLYVLDTARARVQPRRTALLPYAKPATAAGPAQQKSCASRQNGKLFQRSLPAVRCLHHQPIRHRYYPVLPLAAYPPRHLRPATTQRRLLPRPVTAGAAR